MPRSYPKASLSQKRAAAALSALLSGCRESNLKSFTAAGLSAAYNVPIATAERMLTAARLARNL